MSVDFYQACRRHFVDADVLEQGARHQNADQLYALSAECALKAVLVGLNVIPDPTSVEKRYKQHINKLWAEYESALKGMQGGRYVQRLAKLNPFAGWDVQDRYAADWTPGQTPLEAAHRRKAVREQVLVALQDAVSDGVVVP